MIEQHGTTMILWTGDQGRALQVQRACPCGCDARSGPIADGTAVGYITGSTEDGAGFTIYLPTEEAYQTAAAIIGTGVGS